MHGDFRLASLDLHMGISTSHFSRFWFIDFIWIFLLCSIHFFVANGIFWFVSFPYWHHSITSQFWAAYVPCAAQYLDAVKQTLEQIDLIKRMVDRYSDYLRLALDVKGMCVCVTRLPYRLQSRSLQHRCNRHGDAHLDRISPLALELFHVLFARKSS